jgi:hypothetical protein
MTAATRSQGAGMVEARPKGTGWMPLKEWAAITETPWNKALALANPRSKRTSKTFDARDIDRRSNQQIMVWFQPPNPVTGFRRPRFIDRVNPSCEDSTTASGTSGESPLSPSHDQANAESLQRSERSFRPESTGEGA